jgi:hypothetical protein
MMPGVATKRTRRQALVWAVVAAFATGAVVLALRLAPARPGVVVVAATPAAMPVIPPAPRVRAPQAAAAAVPQSNDDITLCGGARVARGADSLADRARYHAAIRLRDVVHRTRVSLHADGGDRALAAAELIVQTVESAEEPPGALQQSLADVLAGIAATTSDPGVYALAYGSCGPAGGNFVGLCAAIDARQWTLLDPGNAMAWIALGAEAEQRGDPAAQDDAMRQAARATRSDEGTDWVLPLVLAHLPPGDGSALPASEIATVLIGVAAARAISQYQTATFYCAADRLADPGRRRVCAALAGVMAEHSNSLLSASIGVRIGERVGWPAERSERLSGEIFAYGTEQGALVMKLWEPDTFGCASARKRLEGLRTLSARSEMEALRAWVAASGRTPEDFIGIGHERASHR